MTNDGSSSYFYRIKEDTTLTLLQNVPYTNIPYYSHKYISYLEGDSSHVFIFNRLALSEIIKLTTVPGYMYIYPSEDFKHITTKYQNTFYLKDISNNTSVGIYDEEAINGDHWINGNSFYLYSKNKNQTLLWHQPPSELSPEELISCFDPNDFYIRSIRSPFN